MTEPSAVPPIPFNRPAVTGREVEYMQQAIANGRSVCFMNHTYVTSPVDIGGIKPSDFELICVAAANLINAGSARNLLFSEYALECDDAADQWV